MLISVVITSYNYEKYLKDTINSIINQTYQNWEMIVVDDASTDSSVEIIQEFIKNDNRIKLIRNEQNLGLAKSLQKGLNAASGEWIAFLESDDMYTTDNLEKKAEIIRQYPDTALIFNDVELFGNAKTLKVKQKYCEKEHENLKDKIYPTNIFYDLCVTNKILTFSAVLVNKTKLLACDFNTPVDKLLDWWIFLPLARKHNFYYIHEKLTKWRMHDDSYINIRQKKLYCPINLTILWQTFLKEKDFKLIFYILKICVNHLTKLREFKVITIRFIKKKLGIPLREKLPNSQI